MQLDFDLQFNPHKRHKSDSHQASDNKRYAHALQGFGDLGITYFFADGGDGYYGGGTWRLDADAKDGHRGG